MRDGMVCLGAAGQGERGAVFQVSLSRSIADKSRYVPLSLGPVW